MLKHFICLSKSTNLESINETCMFLDNKERTQRTQRIPTQAEEQHAILHRNWQTNQEIQTKNLLTTVQYTYYWLFTSGLHNIVCIGLCCIGQWNRCIYLYIVEFASMCSSLCPCWPLAVTGPRSRYWQWDSRWDVSNELTCSPSDIQLDYLWELHHWFNNS